MKESGATLWRSLDCASVMSRDAELGDRGLSLALLEPWLKHRSHQSRRSPGVARSTGPPNISDASLAAWNGSSSAHKWESMRVLAPAWRASPPASPGVMWPRDAYGSWEPRAFVPSAMTTYEPAAALSRFAAGPVSAV